MDTEHIPVIEFDYAFATDTRRPQQENFDDGCDGLNSWINFCNCGKEKSGQDDYVMQSFQNYIDRLGLVKAELQCDQEPSTFDVANALIKRCQSTILTLTATPKRLEGELRTWRKSKFDDSGTASSIS